MKLLLISLITINFLMAENNICDKSYIDINKHSKRAGIFIKATDWDMSKFYIEKLKEDYRVFIGNDCFEKVFEKMNIDKMKEKYRDNIKNIRDLSEMVNETIKEKRKIEKIKIIEQREDAKERERILIREEVRKEILKEYAESK